MSNERIDEIMIDSLFARIQQFAVLAWDGMVLPGEEAVGTTVAPAAEGAAQYAAPLAEPAQGGMFGTPLLILVYVALFGGIWFFMMRPHKKREKKLKELQATIKTGDNVVTNGGMFGKVADVGTDCFVVEMGIGGRTVKVPILKSDVLGVRDPILTPPPKDVV